MNKVAHESFLGNEKIKKDFLEMLNSTEIHHSWLVSGIKSIGKYRLIITLIQELFKSTSNFNERLKAGTITDLLEIEAESNEINVKSIYEIKKFLSLTAAEQKYRVVIIKAAEQLNKHASNALLKILEEPPKYAIIFLITHMPSKLLATIKSRCRHIKLHPVDFEISHFNHLNDKNNAIYKDMSFGSPGKYLELEQANIAQLYLNLIEIISNKDQMALYSLCIDNNKMNKDRIDMLEDLILYLMREIISYFAGIEKKKFFEENTQKIAQIAQNYDIKEWLKIYEEIIQIFFKTKELNLDLKQALLIIFMKITGEKFDEQELLCNYSDILC